MAEGHYMGQKGFHGFPKITFQNARCSKEASEGFDPAAILLKNNQKSL